MAHVSFCRAAAVFTLVGASWLSGGFPQSQTLDQKWVASWTASAHGPYPSGNASAQPVLDFAFESPEIGATEQTFRLVIKPDLWGRLIRLRFANTFGTRPITFDDVFVGLQSTAANLVPGTNTPVTFSAGSTHVALARGTSAWSDPVNLPFVSGSDDRLLSGRKLIVSVHVVGSSGPMTWHAKALTTSYLTAPRAGSHGADENDAAFPFTTTSWFFLDALDVMAPQDTSVIACFGDSITDGTASTLNGDDRWPDALSRRLRGWKPHFGRQRRYRGNQIVGPATYAPDSPVAGGPSALDRLDRDVLSLSGLSAVIWLEGINDLAAGASADAVTAGLRGASGDPCARRHDCRRDHTHVQRWQQHRSRHRGRRGPPAGDQHLHQDGRPLCGGRRLRPGDPRRSDGGLRAHSCPTAPSAGPAIACIPTGRGTRRWPTP